jgi:hypothetical protein
MEKLPNEMNREILQYVYKCRKDEKMVFNKESLEIFSNFTKDCTHVKLLGKNLCQRCDKKAIWKFRMIMNNLLPG